MTLEQVIDTFISMNAIIGVGLITLGDGLRDYVYSKMK